MYEGELSDGRPSERPGTTEYNRLASKEAQDTMSIEQRLSTTGDLISELDDAVERMLNRISPILGPDNRATDPNMAPKDVGESSLLASAIESKNSSLRRLLNQLGEAYYRIEL